MTSCKKVSRCKEDEEQDDDDDEVETNKDEEEQDNSGSNAFLSVWSEATGACSDRQTEEVEESLRSSRDAVCDVQSESADFEAAIFAEVGDEAESLAGGSCA